MAVTSGDGFQDALLVSLVLFSVRENLFDELVEIRVRTKRPLRDELLAAGRALFVAGPQGGHDALGAEPEKFLFVYYRLATYRTRWVRSTFSTH